MVGQLNMDMIYPTLCYVADKFPSSGNIPRPRVFAALCRAMLKLHVEAALPSISGYLYSSNPEAQINTIMKVCSFH